MNLTLQNVFTDSRQVITPLPISQLEAYPNHPYRVVDDTDMGRLVASIRDFGIQTPILVTLGESGSYTIISGHRRVYAAKQLMLETVPAIVLGDVDEDTATILMVDSNLNREHISLKEQVRACGMRYRAVKHQGQAGGGSTRETVASNMHTSSSQVARWLTLDKLVDPLLDLVSEHRIPVRAGLKLSSLSPTLQQILAQYVISEDMKLTIQQAAVLVEHAWMTNADIRQLLEENEQQESQQTVPTSLLIPSHWIPSTVDPEHRIDYIQRALAYYRSHEGA